MRMRLLAVSAGRSTMKISKMPDAATKKKTGSQESQKRSQTALGIS